MIAKLLILCFTLLAGMFAELGAGMMSFSCVACTGWCVVAAAMEGMGTSATIRR
jgi:hypothetical protein